MPFEPEAAFGLELIGILSCRKTGNALDNRITQFRIVLQLALNNLSILANIALETKGSFSDRINENFKQSPMHPRSSSRHHKQTFALDPSSAGKAEGQELNAPQPRNVENPTASSCISFGNSR